MTEGATLPMRVVSDVFLVPAIAPDAMENVYIMGGIGVGKTTLVRSAAATHVVYEEYVNHRLLSDYILNPERHAYQFQLAMMQGACVRTMDAETTLWSASRAARSPKGIIVERPAQENIYFAKANHLCKNISDADYAQYCYYVKQFNLDLAAFRQTTKSVVPPPVAFQPWAPEYMTIQRMIERQRLSEDGYRDKYMCTLPHVYFVAYIELLMIRNLIVTHRPTVARQGECLGVRFDTDESICPDAILPIVIDWTNYGSWDKITRHVATSNIKEWTNQPGNVILRFQQADTTADLMHNHVTGVMDHVTCTDNHYTFNLSWYIRHFKEDVTNKFLAPFRDMFFKARATCSKITFVVDHALFETSFLLNVFTPYPMTQKVIMAPLPIAHPQGRPLENEEYMSVDAQPTDSDEPASFDFWEERG